MSIYIPGMKMPEECAACPLQKVTLDGEISYCAVTRRPTRWWIHDREQSSEGHCPLIPAPPHGRLIDAFDTVKTFCDKGLYKHAEIVSDMPTIIPEDREGEG